MQVKVAVLSGNRAKNGSDCLKDWGRMRRISSIHVKQNTDPTAIKIREGCEGGIFCDEGQADNESDSFHGRETVQIRKNPNLHFLFGPCFMQIYSDPRFLSLIAVSCGRTAEGPRGPALGVVPPLRGQ